MPIMDTARPEQVSVEEQIIRIVLDGRWRCSALVIQSVAHPQRTTLPSTARAAQAGEQWRNHRHSIRIWHGDQGNAENRQGGPQGRDGPQTSRQICPH